MGLFDSVEKGLEKAVRGAFSRGSKSLQPVEIASALRRELDDQAMTLDAGRTLAPNVFTVRLGDTDFERAKAWGVPLAEELCDVVINHAHSQGYILQGPVRVSFNHEDALRPGHFELDSSTEKEGSQPSRPTQAPVRPANPPSPVYRHKPSTTPAKESQPAAPVGQPVLDIDGQRYSLNADSITLGRSSEADILIEDSGISRKHLEIRTEDGHSTAVDLGSTNGSFINGRRIRGSAALHDGDSISMGRSKITFRVLPARIGGRA